MIERFKSSLTFKLIGLIAVGFLAAFIVFGIIGLSTSFYIMNNQSIISDEKLIKIFNIYALTIIALPIIVFLVIFILGTRKRLNYIKYISSQVLDMENLKYVEKLEVKGNDEIARLATNINIMSQKILDSYEGEKRAEEEKRELITAVSHDLKTPLTSIIGYLELMKTNGYNQEYLDIAYSKSISLKKLINELFEYIKLSSNDIPISQTQCNIVTLINQVVGENMPLLSQRGLTPSITYSSDNIQCSIDINRFVRVIENIISNIAKYSDENTEFNINIGNDNSVIITFENKTTLIDPCESNKIFKKMYRIDSARNSKIEGSGLGLAIVKHIVEEHKGRVECNINNNIFKITLYLPNNR
ncbi:MAG: HAMP domain-containing sensor histidine kinase [Clostridium sp.]